VSKPGLTGRGDPEALCAQRPDATANRTAPAGIHTSRSPVAAMSGSSVWQAPDEACTFVFTGERIRAGVLTINTKESCS